MVRIAACAYRYWGLKLINKIELLPSVEVVSINKPDGLKERLDHIKPDIVFFYGWSWQVSDEIIEKYLCLCLHPSPLPKYRGGSPIQNQIINGEVDSAVSIFKLTSERDAGPLCFQQYLSLEGGIQNIFARLTNIGYEATKDIIGAYLDNNMVFWPQEGEPTTFKRRKPRESELSIIEFQNESAAYFVDKIRMLQDPYPNAYIVCHDGSRLYITEAHCG